MIKLTVLYGHPTDPAAFEKYYAETHLPIAGQLTGFVRFELAKGMPVPDGGKPAFYRTADFWFKSAAALQACMNSPAGRATAANLANFATGGVTSLVSEVQA
jgi:uncharacterized protein (TIGR02118 family)